MVSGSTGGKNAALRRTLEIIEEQKYRFDAAHRQSLYSTESISNNKNKSANVVVCKPRSIATSSIPSNLAQSQRNALNNSIKNDEKNYQLENKLLQTKASNNIIQNSPTIISSRSGNYYYYF